MLSKSIERWFLLLESIYLWLHWQSTVELSFRCATWGRALQVGHTFCLSMLSQMQRRRKRFAGSRNHWTVAVGWVNRPVSLSLVSLLLCGRCYISTIRPIILEQLWADEAVLLWYWYRTSRVPNLRVFITTNFLLCVIPRFWEYSFILNSLTHTSLNRYLWHT